MKALVRYVGPPLALLVATAISLTPARAELLEEIVAQVNGEIITKTDLEQEEQAMVAEAYKRYTGDELDQNVKDLRENLLVEMIDRKILLDRARLMFTDLDGVKKMYYEGFKESQGITDDAEFAKMLQKEGMTIESFKERLLEMYAPDEVLRYEVGNRISVSDKEIREFYDSHPEQFELADVVTVREIVLLADDDEKKQARRAEAEQIVERARSGEDFAALASEVSEAGTKAEGGLLGEVKRGDLSAQLEAVAFTLPAGQVSDPIEMPYGFHILMVVSRTVDERVSFDDAKDRIRKFLEDQKYQEQLQSFRVKIRNEAEWCVNAKYVDRVPKAVKVTVCGNL